MFKNPKLHCVKFWGEYNLLLYVSQILFWRKSAGGGGFSVSPFWSSCIQHVSVGWPVYRSWWILRNSSHPNILSAHSPKRCLWIRWRQETERCTSERPSRNTSRRKSVHSRPQHNPGGESMKHVTRCGGLMSRLLLSLRYRSKSDPKGPESLTKADLKPATDMKKMVTEQRHRQIQGE